MVVVVVVVAAVGGDRVESKRGRKRKEDQEFIGRLHCHTKGSASR